jgi:uncharacterized protein
MTIDIRSLIVAAGGEIVGKIRLQKVVYLLDQSGLSSGFSYEYHHYGPYSKDLAEQVEDDVVFDGLIAVQHRRQTDGVPYVVYSANVSGDVGLEGASLLDDRLRGALAEMQNRSATVLELAATAHWLAVAEGRADWRAELQRRKGSKTQNGREVQALELLRKLGLPPAVDFGANAGP